MSDTRTSEKKLTGVSYRIERSVTADGTPEYVLYSDAWVNTLIFGAVARTSVVARNRDRGVLEQAVIFLKVGE